MLPLVSILIPAFNAEYWIKETIHSALAQTWPRKEIVVVDDGSSDATVATVRRFGSPLVKVVAQENQGAAAARNLAYSNCQGDYIQWLDADDLLSPSKLELQMEALQKHNARRTLVASSWGTFYYRTQRLRMRPSVLWEDLPPVEWTLRKMEHNTYMPIHSWLISRELAELAGPWDTRLSLDDDGEYLSRVILNSDGIHFVPHATALYRMSGTGSLSNAYRSSKRLDSWYMAAELQVSRLLGRLDSERARKACVSFLREISVAFYPQRLDLFEKVRQRVARLGESLEQPELPGKYGWIHRLSGSWSLAKSAMVGARDLRASVEQLADRALFMLQSHH
jgi:glycosyltransferase involved in cell wall biosynthesis